MVFSEKYTSEKYRKNKLKVYFLIFSLKEILMAHLNKLFFRKGLVGGNGGMSISGLMQLRNTKRIEN